MTQPTADITGTDDNTEALFRRVMAYATDQAWNLRVDEAVLAALYDVLKAGVKRHHTASRDDHLPK